MTRDAEFGTLSVHAGTGPDAATGAIATPIVLSSTFTQDGVGGLRNGYEYSRSSNPTRAELETVVAQLEGARFASAFSSGLAALDAVLRTVPDGGVVVCSDDAYGGTLRLAARLHGDRVRLRVGDLSDPSDALLDGAALVLVETPTNPMLRIVDIAALSATAHHEGAVVAVDSTFATPFNTTPLALGADVVLHSSTKYLSGHSDVVGGVVVTDDPDIAERVSWIQNAAGAVPSPFDCYLVIRGIRTLAVRMERHAENASAVAEALAGRLGAGRVHYPGLASHPHHAVAARQMRTPGGMVAIDLGSASAAHSFAEQTRIFTLAESLGAVESLVEVPAAMTHASLAPLRDAGLPVAVPPAGLVRLSVGIEAAGDLVDDVLDAIGSAISG
jgi:cystathionine gamma-synthase